MKSKEELIFRYSMKLAGLLAPLQNRGNGRLISGGI